mmetsp:Transcript_19749/g.54384  ORF Transcript_19749/g.54384 Transcript_19749/m.54384 type:complete len:422 (-) Transcript_19749:164-1429(-)
MDGVSTNKAPDWFQRGMPQKAQIIHVQQATARQYHVGIVIGKVTIIVIDAVVQIGTVRNELSIVGNGGVAEQCGVFLPLPWTVGDFARHGAHLSVRMTFPQFEPALDGGKGIKGSVIVVIQNGLGAIDLDHLGMIAVQEVVFQPHLEGIDDTEGVVVIARRFGKLQQLSTIVRLVHMTGTVPNHHHLGHESRPIVGRQHGSYLSQGLAQSIRMVGHENDGQLGFVAFGFGGNVALPILGLQRRRREVFIWGQRGNGRFRIVPKGFELLDNAKGGQRGDGVVVVASSKGNVKSLVKRGIDFVRIHLVASLLFLFHHVDALFFIFRRSIQNGFQSHGQGPIHIIGSAVIRLQILLDPFPVFHKRQRHDLLLLNFDGSFGRVVQHVVMTLLQQKRGPTHEHQTENDKGGRTRQEERGRCRGGCG